MILLNFILTSGQRNNVLKSRIEEQRNKQDSWFVFHDFSLSFHELYFSRKHKFHESYRVNRTQDYDLETCK